MMDNHAQHRDKLIDSEGWHTYKQNSSAWPGTKMLPTEELLSQPANNKKQQTTG
jgi:hypothetical protein